ncbi:MAG: hypothetical protein ACTHK6_07995 [Solirubrobacterales bacterium]
MEQGSARQIADGWLEVAEEFGYPDDGYREIAPGSRLALSDQALAGIGFEANHLVVLALDHDCFVRLRIEGAADLTEPSVCASALPLRNCARLDLVSARETNQRGNSIYLVRNWTLTVPGADALEVTTRAPLTRSLVVDPGGDAVMIAVAERLGWPLPSPSI